MNAPLRPLYVPSDEDVQAAIGVLHAHWCAEHEACRQEREEGIRQRVADWLFHARQCRRRALEYRREAPRDPEYYRPREAEQWRKAREAMRWAKIERNALDG